VGFAAEVTRLGAIGSFEIPFVDFERLISTLDHEPVNGMNFYNSANLALELSQCAHGPENGPFPG
jgi:hypothetical protein